MPEEPCTLTSEEPCTLTNKATPPLHFRITQQKVILNPNLLSCLSPHLKDDTFSRGFSIGPGRELHIWHILAFLFLPQASRCQVILQPPPRCQIRNAACTVGAAAPFRALASPSAMFAAVWMPAPQFFHHVSARYNSAGHGR